MRKKILIVTQKVDRRDPNLGFFHRWIEEFAKHADVTVLTSFVGDHAFPSNVRVFSFGKDWGAGHWRRIANYRALIRRYAPESDAVFFHMIPEFVAAALPGILFWNCRTALWYVHGSVPVWLRIAEKLVDVVFSVNPASFRLPSRKIIYTGHAIDTELFKPAPAASDHVRLMTAGRASPVKHVDTIEEAVAGLSNMTFDTISDSPHTEMPAIYTAHDLFLSLSSTGSVDKAVLEAMACGLTVITANEAFRDIVPPRYFLERRDPALLRAKILELADDPRPNLELRAIVEKNHSMQKTIQAIAERLVS